MHICKNLLIFSFLPLVLSACESPKENFSFSETNPQGLAVCGGMTVRSSTGSDSEKWTRIEAMYDDYHRTAFPNVPDITAVDAKAALEAGTAIIVDTRLDEEQKISMIPGAISKEEFEKNADNYRGKMIINYCTIGYRSGIYTRKLRNRGFNATNLKGSVLAWAHAGFDFDLGGQSTKCAHVYGEDWNLLPESYKAVW